MSSLNNRHLLVRNWGRAKYRYMQLLGQFLWQAQTRSGESNRAVVATAREVGQSLNLRLISEVEALRNTDPDDEHEPKYQPTFWTVVYLIWHFGYSLAQFEDYLRTGATRDATERERANAVTQTFLALPEEDRQEVENFIAYRHQQASARTITPDDNETPLTPRRTTRRPATSNEMGRLDATRAVAYAQPDD